MSYATRLLGRAIFEPKKKDVVEFSVVDVESFLVVSQGMYFSYLGGIVG